MTWKQFTKDAQLVYPLHYIKALRYGLVKQRILGKFLKNARVPLNRGLKYHRDIQFAINDNFVWNISFEGTDFWAQHHNVMIQNFNKYKKEFSKKPSIFRSSK